MTDTAAPPPQHWRRRAFLATLGTGWAAYGAIGVLGDPSYSRSRGLTAITAHVPMGVLGWVWVGCGALALVAAARPCWARLHDLGFAALAAPAALWGAAFTVAAVTTYRQAAGSACGWLAFALGVVWAAGMDDPPPAEKREEGGTWTSAP
ncbi:hypothetical protein [Streptomyces sp. Tu6071]|uniref:hypothetical protein n=1 Tax=Streptomyces sp. Tu6071 TaxID=355249 RepID=UPI00031A01D6|nr:hypothetical protein [Streptomyces sp. Tu6071]